jgi:uncharacterized protein YcbX
VAFADGFPFLIISENSLAALNHEMQLNLPMARFRPNLVISGCPAYEEDNWREIRIGAIDFRLPKPCSVFRSDNRPSHQQAKNHLSHSTVPENGKIRFILAKMPCIINADN